MASIDTDDCPDSDPRKPRGINNQGVAVPNPTEFDVPYLQGPVFVSGTGAAKVRGLIGGWLCGGRIENFESLGAQDL